MVTSLALPNKRFDRSGTSEPFIVNLSLAQMLPARSIAALGAETALAFIGLSRYRSFMIDWSSCPAVERDPEKVNGSWVFRNTRVPVIALFENLEGGAAIDDFLLWFPGVTKEQVEAVLEFLKSDLQAA
jgi:uncharacterized protein (DUF433 family)